MLQLTWCVTVATTYKLKSSGKGWYYLTCYNCLRVAKRNYPSYVCKSGHKTETEIYRYELSKI